MSSANANGSKLFKRVTQTQATSYTHAYLKRFFKMMDETELSQFEQKNVHGLHGTCVKSNKKQMLN